MALEGRVNTGWYSIPADAPLMRQGLSSATTAALISNVDVVPQTTDAIDLGKTGQEWNNVYAKNVATGTVNATGTTYAKRLQVGQSDTFGGVVEQIGGGVFRIRPVQNQDGCSMLFQSTQFAYRNSANQSVFLIDPVNNNLYFSYLPGIYIGDANCTNLTLNAGGASGILNLNSSAGVVANNTLDRVGRFINARTGGASIPTTTWTTALWTSIDDNNTGITYSAGKWTNSTSVNKLLSIHYMISWDANTAGSRITTINRHDNNNVGNGAFGTSNYSPAQSNSPVVNGSTVMMLNAGHNFTIDIYQDSGTTLNYGQAANGTPAGSSTRLTVAVI